MQFPEGGRYAAQYTRQGAYVCVQRERSRVAPTCFNEVSKGSMSIAAQPMWQVSVRRTYLRVGTSGIRLGYCDFQWSQGGD